MEEKDQHFVGKVAHKALILKDGKALVVKAAGDQFWDLPGGRIHTGEKPNEALIREVREEIGVGIHVEGPFFADLIQATKTGEWRYFVCFRATLTDPNQAFQTLTDEVTQTQWVGASDVDTLVTYNVCKDALKAHFGVK